MDSWIQMEPSFSCWPAMMLLCNSVRIFPVHIALKLICSVYLNFIANFLNSYHVFWPPVCSANFPATFQHVLRLLQLPLRPPTLISRKLVPNVGSMQLSPHNNLTLFNVTRILLCFQELLCNVLLHPIAVHIPASNLPSPKRQVPIALCAKNLSAP